MNNIRDLVDNVTIGDILNNTGVRVRKVGKDDFRKAFFITNHPKAKSPEDYGVLNREVKTLNVIVLIKNNGQ